MIRDVTTRPDIAYPVVKYSVEEEEQRVKALVEEKLEQYSDGQVIVYCRTIEQVQRVAEYTGGQAFYRAIGNGEEKASFDRAEHTVVCRNECVGVGGRCTADQVCDSRRLPVRDEAVCTRERACRT